MKILLISPYFPPYNAIGAARTGKLAKHLVSQGHEVKVVAAVTNELAQTLPLEIPEEHVVRCPNLTPDALLLRRSSRERAAEPASAGERSLRGAIRKRLYTIYNSLVCIPDRFSGWILPGLFVAHRLAREFEPDIIIASAQPYSALLVGRSVARRRGIPFVAEFRDLWTDNHYLELPRWRRAIDGRLENAVCRDAAALVTVSDPLAHTLRKRHRRPTEVVHNGFDPDDVVPAAYGPDATFDIVYTGLIYPGLRDPTLLFKALRSLGDEAANVRVRFFGRRLETVRELAAREGVSHLVSIEGEVPYREALARQAGADVLLLLLWDTPEERGVLTGKLFEYIASRRPILLIGGGDGAASQLLRERGAGLAAETQGDIEAQLRTWLRQHAEGGVPPLPASVRAGFSRAEQFSRLTARLEEIAARQKICIVTRKLDVGGTERHLVQTLPLLDRTRFEIEVTTLYRGGVLETALQDMGIRVKSPAAALRPLALLESVARVFFAMRRERSTLFHFWLPEAYLIGGLCGVLLRHRRMIMSRRSLNRYQRRHPVLARLEHRLHPRILAAVGNSSAIAEELAQEGVPKGRMHVIENGVNLDRLEPLRSRREVREDLGLRGDALVAICVANLIHYKGHLDLLSGLALAKKRTGTLIHLVCAGRDDGMGPSLIRRAESLGICETVTFLGSRSDVPDLLNAADICVLASHEEGSSNAIIEAMAVGLPTIATDVGGNREAIEHERTGLLVPQRNPEALSEALVRLAESAEFRRQLGEAAREHARARYEVSRSVSRYEEFYASITLNERA